MDLSNLAPNWSNVLTPDTLKVVGALVAFMVGKWAIGKAWAVTKYVVKTTTASMSLVGVMSAVLLMGGFGGIGAGIGEVNRWRAAHETCQVAEASPDKLPDDTVSKGAMGIGLGIGAAVVSITTFLRKYG